jgi:hypothetical protein
MHFRRGSLLRAAFALGLTVLVSNAAGAQVAADVSLYGIVTHRSSPMTQSGDRVIANLGNRFFGPALTDNSGAYYFYNLPQGTYVVRVYVNGEVKWVNDVDVQGQTRYDILVTQ